MKKHRLHVVAPLSACLLLAVLFAVAEESDPPGPPGSLAARMKTLNQVEPRTAILELPYAITNSGSYYLTCNLKGVASSNGITITADNVELDLNGFALIGRSNALSGVSVPSPKHNTITVLNGSVKEWGQDGIGASYAEESRFIGLSAYGNGDEGIQVGDYCYVLSCGAHKNKGTGIFAQNGATVSDCKATDNGGHGFEVYSASRIERCMSARNGQSGIRAKDNCCVSECTSIANTNSGVYAMYTCRLSQNYCADNKGSGLTLDGSGCRIEQNCISGSVTGIVAIGGGGNLLFGNSVYDSVVGYKMSAEGDYYGRIVNPAMMGTNGFVVTNAWANFLY